MKANLHWIKKLLQVSFVPAEIRPGKSRPEIYMVPPPKKQTSLHVLLAFAPVVWLCQKNKKPRENQKKQYSRTLAKANIQKTSRKPKKQKNQKKQYSRTLAKVKMQKSKKPRENQKKQKKQYSRSLEIGSTGKSPGTLVFLVFLFFLVFSRFFAFLLLQESWNIVFFDFFVFWVFSRFFGFLLLQESWNTVFFLFFGFLEVF